MPIEDLEFLRSWLAEEEAAAASASGAAEAAEQGGKAGGNIDVSVPEETKKKMQPKKSTLKTLDKASGIAGNVVPDLDDFPTGGTALLLFLILLIVFAILPAPGHDGRTRLSVLWQAILGNAELTDSGSPQGSQSVGNVYVPPGLNIPIISGPDFGAVSSQ